MNTDTRIVRAELVAAKVNTLKNGGGFASARVQLESDPRFAELLWFLQWVSQPQNHLGGLGSFARRLLERDADTLGTPRIVKLGAKPWSEDDALAIHAELPEAIQRTISAAEIGRGPEGRAALWELMRNAADWDFPLYLADLCEQAHRGLAPGAKALDFEHTCCAPWYFSVAGESLFRAVEQWRAEQLAEIAETSITKPVFHWLDVARQLGEGVVIQGTTRFGKTEAARAWCLASPGRARFVETPAGNGERELWRAVGRALCIEGFERLPGVELCRQIAFVLDQSRLMLVFDEAQFLFPATYSRTTQPKRLNWVRREIMDRGLAIGLIATPQSYAPDKAKFVRKTGFAIDQFDGRLLPTVALPDALTVEDLHAIAAKHFVGLAEPCLAYVAGVLKGCELHSARVVVSAAKLAFLKAREDGRDTPEIADIDAALAALFPSPAVPQNPPCKPSAQRTATPALAVFARRSAPAPTPAPAASLPLSRSLSPLTLDAEAPQTADA